MAGPANEQSTYSYRPEYNVGDILWSQTKIFEAAQAAWVKIGEVLRDMQVLSEECLSFQQLNLEIRPSLLELQASLGLIVSLSWMIRQ
jgi:hypothetical protein